MVSQELRRKTTATTHDKNVVSRDYAWSDEPTRLPFGDIIDRLSIHLLCRRRAAHAHDSVAHRAYEVSFHDDPRLSTERKQHYLRSFLAINGEMWKLEAALRTPTTQSLAELGTIALELRAKNIRRNSLKRAVDAEVNGSGAVPSSVTESEVTNAGANMDDGGTNVSPPWPDRAGDHAS